MPANKADGSDKNGWNKFALSKILQRSRHAQNMIAHVEKNLKLQMPRAYKSDGAAIKSSE